MKLKDVNKLNLNLDLLSSYKKKIFKKIVSNHKKPNNSNQEVIKIKWGKNKDEENFIFIEDGFLRSVGLGSAIIDPISWVFDSKGMYYDPSSESELEYILNKINLNKWDIKRSREVQKNILKNNLTKYNLMQSSDEIFQDKNSILVIGQVENDLSIKLGGTVVQKNLDLLKMVKQNFPFKRIYFKPHPDYEFKLRSSSQNYETDLLKHCDFLLKDVSILDCFNITDTIAVNTSLAGFEALMRGKKVICFGEPFYSGWGLTEDMSKKYIHRRKRKLTLDELVYGALIEYPTYFNTRTGKEISIEEAVIFLAKKKYRSNLKSLIINNLVRLRNVIRK